MSTRSIKARQKRQEELDKNLEIAEAALISLKDEIERLQDKKAVLEAAIQDRQGQVLTLDNTIRTQRDGLRGLVGRFAQTTEDFSRTLRSFNLEVQGDSEALLLWAKWYAREPEDVKPFSEWCRFAHHFSVHKAIAERTSLYGLRSGSRSDYPSED